jgi:CRISPR/Cas system CMR-associated protein Cmr5 small subunit
MSGVTTRQQQMAERAFRAVDGREHRSPDYDSFAKEFPALIHSAGLCQAVAFALAKKKDDVLNDVVRVMAVAQISDGEGLNAKCLKAGVMEYLRLSQLAIQAATWVKRYVEAIEPSPQPAKDERGSS